MSGIISTNKKSIASFYLPGPKGDDAYVVAVSQGFEGTKAQWLASLHGADSFVPGPAGYTPRKGIDYFDGIDGHTPVKGVDYFDGAASTVPGPSGRAIELQKSSSYVQWRYVGDVSWNNLILLSDLKGTDGVTQDISGKVDKVTGKVLSSNDYTDAEKEKLSGLDAGADVNVQPDWNEADSGQDDYIKNKPTIPAAQVQTDWNASSGMGQLLNKPTIPTVPTALSSFTDDSTHRLVTDTNIAAWNAKADNNLAIAMAVAL